MHGIFINDQERFVGCSRIYAIPHHQGVKFNKCSCNSFGSGKLAHSPVGCSASVCVERCPFMLVCGNKAANLDLAGPRASSTRRRPGNNGFRKLHGKNPIPLPGPPQALAASRRNTGEC